MQGNNQMQTLDAELAKLKAIGVKEISKSTKLATSKIEDVLEKRFDKIDKVRAKGFIAILEREYDVDLRDWISLQQQTQSDVKSVSEVISRQDEEERVQRILENTAKEQEIKHIKETKKQEQKKHEHRVLDLALKSEQKEKNDTESYTWLFAILGLILLALMGYFAYKAFMQDTQIVVANPPTSTHSSQDSQDLEQSGYDGMFFDTSDSQQDTQSNSEKSRVEEVQTVTATDVIDINEPQKEETLSQQNHPEQNFFFAPSSAQSTQNTESEVQTSSNKINDNILHIQSDMDLWLGVIYLNTGNKEQFSYRQTYDIPLRPQMLFVMGHSSFKLTLNGEEIPHGNKHPVRMYYDGTNLIDVGYTRFKQLNGGMEW